jgi:hypothetical protein
MAWRDAAEVGLVVIGSLGGGGAIVFGLSGFLGRIWLARLESDINSRLHKLEATLEHGNFLLQRFAEFELEATRECWSAARACLPRINATRPADSGTEETTLQENFRHLAAAHDNLLGKLGQHEPFLIRAIADNLESIGQAVRRELSQIQHSPHFKGKWWDQGESNRNEVKRLSDALLELVKNRIRELRASAENARS